MVAMTVAVTVVAVNVVRNMVMPVVMTVVMVMVVDLLRLSDLGDLGGLCDWLDLGNWRGFCGLSSYLRSFHRSCLSSYLRSFHGSCLRSCHRSYDFLRLFNGSNVKEASPLIKTNCVVAVSVEASNDSLHVSITS